MFGKTKRQLWDQIHQKSYEIGLATGMIVRLEKRVYELEHPKKITRQNIAIRGNTIYFNGHSLSLSGPKDTVNLAEYRENDTVEDAVADKDNIYVTMKSGDKFTVEHYSPFNDSTRVVRG